MGRVSWGLVDTVIVSPGVLISSKLIVAPGSIGAVMSAEVAVTPWFWKRQAVQLSGISPFSW